MSLFIPDEVRERVNEALNEGFPLAFHAVSADSQPIVSFRGSAQTHGDDSLAIWVRSDPSATLEAIAQNPSVAMTYTNMPARKFWIFRGQASLVTDEAQRNQIWEGQHPLEQSRDEQRTGKAVVVRLDSIQGSGVDLRRESTD